MADASTDPLSGLRAEPDARDRRAPSLLRAWEGEALDGRAVVLGFPYDGGIPSRPGARFGPRAIRDALAAFGTFDGEREVAPALDLGDAALPTTDGGAAHAAVEEAARRVFAADGWPIFLGGDHGVTGSIVRGFAAARPDAALAVVNVDAHLDVREYADADHLSSGTPFRRALETPVLDGNRVAMIGIRPFANSEHYLAWAASRGVILCTTDEVEASGPARAARDALQRAAAGADALYLSIDMDAADAAFAPGVSAPGTGGLSASQMIALVREIAAHPRIVGADIMETSPPYDEGGRTARLAARLLLELLRARG